MAKLPTVKLVHRRTGRRMIINQTDYAANIGGYRDWKIAGERRGDATDAEIVRDAAEAEIERQRKADPKREKRFGDKARQQAERTLTVTQATAEKSVDEKPKTKTWDEVKDMKWFAIRSYVADVTGKTPTNKEQAKALLEEV